MPFGGMDNPAEWKQNDGSGNWGTGYAVLLGIAQQWKEIGKKINEEEYYWREFTKAKQWGFTTAGKGAEGTAYNFYQLEYICDGWKISHDINEEIYNQAATLYEANHIILQREKKRWYKYFAEYYETAKKLFTGNSEF